MGCWGLRVVKLRTYVDFQVKWVKWVVISSRLSTPWVAGDRWTTARHYAVPTTDLPVHEEPALLRSNPQSNKVATSL